MILRVAFLSLIGASLATPLQAQNDLVGTTGLGRLLQPTDARARALGGSAMALHDGNLSAVNPASMSRLRLTGIWATYLSEKRDVTGEGISGDVTTVDFPLARAALTTGQRWTVAVSAGTFLDQDFGVQFIDSLELSTGFVEFEETRTSNGGVAKFGLEVSRTLGTQWTLGLAAQVYRGESILQVDRAFEEDADFLPYRSVAAVQYRGFGGALGMEFQPIPEMILGAAASWGPGLDVENDSTGAELDLPLPLTIGGGGSWQLTPGLLAALSLEWQGWSALDEDLASGANDSWRFGGGLEYALTSSERTALLLRLGGRWARLPFKLQGNAPSERAFTFGLGVRLQGGRAHIDATGEVGSRADIESNGVEESFNRYSVSLAVFTN